MVAPDKKQAGSLTQRGNVAGGKTRDRAPRVSRILLFVFPRFGASDGFLPAGVTDVTFGGFDAWAEFALNHRFRAHFIQIVPEAYCQACGLSGTQRGNFAHFRTFYACAENV